MRNTILLLVALVQPATFLLQAGPPVKKGFEALAVYDYFKAKACFYKALSGKQASAAAYGLATIYARRDNPFTNADSAARYVNLAYFLRQAPARQNRVWAGFVADSAAVLSLADSIAVRQLALAKKQNTVAAYEQFLLQHLLCSQKLKHTAVYLRDELEFNRALAANSSDTTLFFMRSHPGNSFYHEADMLKDRQLFDEWTQAGTAASYIGFMRKYPANIMHKQALERLFTIYRQAADAQGLAFFVKTYPAAPQSLEAWKLLFSLSVKAYSYSELKRFLTDFPEFPLKNSILKELELNKLVYYPYQAGEFMGFINEEGRQVIAPVYDAVSEFREGLSVVQRNDSVFYINKEASNPFDAYYEDAQPFKNGLAPVKVNGKWVFINRQGQQVSKLFDEVNELSNNLYVVKQGDKYGALDQYAQTLIEPVYDKLGDFKNDFAYYAGKEGYGFVSVSGQAYKPEFEWISDFDEAQIAVMKQNGKYGLVNGRGRMLLEARYDLVVRAAAEVFLVVLNNQYGFFAAKGCFILGVAYDYSKEKQPEFYTNGRYFRLMKKKGQSIVDENGVGLQGLQEYNEVNFYCNGLMRVKKKKKYGYLDRRMNTAIPFKFEEAGDFSDSLACVVLKGRHLLINLQGKEVYSDVAPIKKLSAHLYEVDGESKTLLNHRGEVLATGVSAVERVNSRLWVVTTATNEIKLIND